MTSADQAKAKPGDLGVVVPLSAARSGVQVPAKSYKVLKSKTCGCEIWQDFASKNLVGIRVAPECRDTLYTHTLMTAFQVHLKERF